tara:strand:- start:618 stop:1775 length:1158 start_codon:yes stop_codon:yes gene_type:complete
VTLILPKQVGSIERTLTCLNICHKYKTDNKGAPIPNNIFKENIISNVESFDKSTDGALLIKQSEISRYFGLIERPDWGNHQSITEEGELFLENQHDIEFLSELIIKVLEEGKIKFGRENHAVKSSISNIEPPKLILQSIRVLGFCNHNEIAYILDQTHEKDKYFEEVLDDIKKFRETTNWLQLTQTDFKNKYIERQYHNKFYDIKFINFFIELGILVFNENRYELTKYSQTNYYDRIFKLSIYNNLTYRPSIDSKKILESSLKLFKYKNSILKRNPEKFGNKSPLKIKQTRNQYSYERDPLVVFWVLNNSKGICECCDKKAPFIDKKGKPFLEVHHVKYLASGGSDLITNTVALCPNCHRKIHYSSEEESLRNFLYQKINRLQPE